MKRQHWLGCLLWLIIFSLYISTSARTMTGFGDSDELIAAGYSLSVPHPPGYPLLVGLIYMFTHLPQVAPAVGAQGLAAIIMSLTMLLLYYVGLELLEIQRRKKQEWMMFAVWVGTLMTAISGLIWEHGTYIEVFSLNALLSLVVLWLTLRLIRFGQKNRIFYILTCLWGVAAGLGLAHQQTFVLILAPIAAILGYFLVKQKQIHWVLPFIAGLALLVSFVSGYGLLWLLGWRQSPFSWKIDTSLLGLWNFYLRNDYSGYSTVTGFLSAWWGGVSLSQTVEAIQFFVSELWLHWGLFCGFGLFGLLNGKQLLKQRYWLILMPWIIAGPVLAGYLTLLGTSSGSIQFETSRAITERMYLLSEVWWGIFTIQGLVWVISFLRKKFFKHKRWLYISGLVCMIGFLTGWIGLRFSDYNLTKYTLARDYMVSMTAALPQGSRLICLSDLSCFGMNYLQTILHSRPDVAVISNAPQYRYLGDSQADDLSRFRYPDNPFRLGETIGWATYKGHPVFISQLDNTWARELGLNTEAFWLVPAGFSFEVRRLPPKPQSVKLDIPVLPKLSESFINHHRFVKVLRSTLAEQTTINASLYARMGLFEQARETVNTGLTAFPSDNGLLKMRDSLPHLMPDPGYQQPVDENSYLRNAQSCRQRGEIARDLWQSRWMNWRNPEDVVSRLNFAMAFENADLAPLAKREYKHVLDLDSLNVQAKLGLKRLAQVEDLPY